MLPKTVWISLACLAFGFMLVCSGGLLAGFWPQIYQRIISKSLELTPEGTSYKIWRDSPVPIYIDFYFFNWTNPHDILDHDTKPAFQQLGPYRFIERKEKSDIVWNDNNTVSFKQKRNWYYDPDHSNGTLEDELTTLNIIAFTAAYVSRDWNYFLVLPLSQLLKSHSIHVTHTVGEFLFEGFSDPLITMGKVGSVFAKGVAVPYDKFGWFYTRNGSDSFDGHYNMHTGVGDISQMGTLARWNFENMTKSFPGTCGHVRGSAGELFPPERKKSEPLTIFSADICRTMSFDYVEDTKVGDLNGYRYSAGPQNMDNGTVDPRNECYCGGQCVPSGLLNVSTCKFGAPAFVSYPHFYQADPYYLNSVDGLAPEKEKHSFDITLEPTTGIPLEVTGRLQINLLVQPYKMISLFSKLPTVFFPMMWFEQGVTITPELSVPLGQLINLSTMGLVGSLVAFTLGVVVICAITFLHWYNTQIHKLPKKLDKIHDMQHDANREALSPLMVRPAVPKLADSVYFDACSEKARDSPVGIKISRRNSSPFEGDEAK